MNPVIMLNERWRLTDDGQLQWLLQYRKGVRWQNKGYITSKADLLEVARGLQAIGSLDAELLPLAQGVWWPQDQSSKTSQGS